MSIGRLCNMNQSATRISGRDKFDIFQVESEELAVD
jgi:hypothetical protein